MPLPAIIFSLLVLYAILFVIVYSCLTESTWNLAPGGGGGMPQVPGKPKHETSIRVDPQGRNGQVKYTRNGKDSELGVGAEICDGKLCGVEVTYKKD